MSGIGWRGNRAERSPGSAAGLGARDSWSRELRRRAGTLVNTVGKNVRREGGRGGFGCTQPRAHCSTMHAGFGTSAEEPWPMTLKSVNLVVGSSCTTSPSATKSSSPPMASSASAMVPICTCAAASRGNVGASRLKPHASCVVDDAFPDAALAVASGAVRCPCTCAGANQAPTS